MRIEAYAQVQQVYRSKSAAQVVKAPGTSFSDQLQISSIGKDIHTVKNALKQVPDVREDVTAPIKAQIQAGTYDVSAESFAEKLLAKYEGTR